jgi:hypothetical protein
MVDDAGQRIDTWEEIEDAIARKIDVRLAAEMIDHALAALRARELAGDAVRAICSFAGGGEVYVPKLARHHREERDTQIQLNFNGDCKETAQAVPSPIRDKPHLSVRQVRRIACERK